MGHKRKPVEGETFATIVAAQFKDDQQRTMVIVEEAAKPWVAAMAADNPNSRAYYPVVRTERIAFRVTKNPPARKPWTKRRVIASAAVLVPATLLTLGMFGWLAIVATDSPVRIAATIGVGFVIAVLVWFVRKAQCDHREVSPEVS